MFFSSGKCNSSHTFFCKTAIATKPMTVLRAVAYFDFDFPLNFTLEKSYKNKQKWNKMFTRMIIIFLCVFFVVVVFLAKFREITDACNFFSTV